MDIVAESLSANILKARNVTVRGQDVLTWFESKLSASVSFAGVFRSLDDAPRRHGAVAIVGSKDYIYSSTTSAWQEFGDEGQIGVLMQAVAALSSDISSCATSSDVDSALSVKQDKISVDGILSCDGDGNVAPVKMPQNISDLSNDVGYLSVELEPAFAAVSSTFLTAHQNLSGYYQKTETSSAAEIQVALSGKQPSGNYLTGEEEPAFAAVSSTFLTAHQDLSGYYRKTETSSAAQLQALQNATGVSIWSDPYQANDNATDPTGPAIWFYPRAFGAPDGAYINTITIHTTAIKPEHIPGTNVYARIYQEGEETNPLTDSWPVNVVSVDTPYTFNLKKEVPLDSNRKYGVRFYRCDNSNVAVIGYHLYAYHKTEGGPYPNPGTDIAYGAWNDTAGKNLLRPALSVSWTVGIQHPIPADLSDFTNSPGYLVSNDISDYCQKSETSSAIQIAVAIDSIRNMISSAMTSTYEYEQHEIGEQ